MALSNVIEPKEFKVTDADSLGNILNSVTNSKSITLVSEFPSICRDEACLLGVDEAGRGPVLGPMVYGISYCPISKQDELKKLGCADSKILTEEKRGVIFKELCNEKKSTIGWAVEIISPNIICNSMFSRQKKSLNQVSHDSAIGLIKRALNGGMNVTHVYVDTVGPADKYQDKLSEIFPQLNITVASKADATYPIVSAASICAKVIRDFALQAWKFPEGIELPENKNWGSGYPNDPVTKKFMLNNIDPVFGYPQLVRFSWSTASKLLDENAVQVEWDDEEDESDFNKVSNNTSITSFFKTDSSSKTLNSSHKRKKHQFFIDRKLTSTVSFDF